MISINTHERVPMSQTLPIAAIIAIVIVLCYWFFPTISETEKATQQEPERAEQVKK